jgi:hypothetical protein
MKKNIILLIVSFFFTSLAYSQSDEVKQQLITIAYLMAQENYEITHDVVYTYLDESETDNFTLNLKKHYTYRIAAVCDGDCGDIDLKLYDENGNDIATDKDEDDNPIIEVSPKWTGEFELNVEMYDCDIEPCKVGIIVFGKYIY